MTIQFSPYQIISSLDRLGIKRDGDKPTSKGWLSILCPNHHDTQFGSCSINLNSGFIKCFVCGYGQKGESKSIVSLVKDRLGYDFKQAKHFIEEGYYVGLNQSHISTEKPKKKRIKPLYNFTSLDFNPDDFYYTKQRKITNEFIRVFNIKQSVSGWFTDYFIIPIVDTAKGINEYEARRLKEYEVLCDFYEVKGMKYEVLKRQFKELCDNNHIRLNKKTYQVLIDTEVYEDERIKYLLKPKTLYISNSRCQETIWNIDNLNYDEPLYLVEGIASTCSIWAGISKNVSAIFGVSITDAQIDYLKKFKSIIYIPDFDVAGYNSVDFMRKYLTNFVVCDSIYDDTEEEYLGYIKKENYLTPEQYIVKHFPQFRLKR